VVGGAPHADRGLAADTAYQYEVAALDAAGNESARSAPAAATTLAAGAGQLAATEQRDLPPPAQATVTLTPAADTYLQEESPTEANGDTAEVSVDGSARGGKTQALVRFDLAEIPEGSEVVSAILTIQTTDGGKGADFHRVLVTWDEGATWDSLDAGIAADDAEAASSADFSTGGVDDGPATFDVTAPVQAWVNGTANHGWALLPLGSNGWDFSTREGATPPQLTVTFVPPSG
jgi:hypothetical protein